MDSSDPATGFETGTSVFARRETPDRRPRARRGLAVPVLAGLLGLTTLWGGAASYFLIFHDDVLARFLTQQRAMQIAYEDRVGALQLQVDRAGSERAVMRAGLERRIAAVFDRQSLIERRQSIVAGLTGGQGGTLPVAVVSPTPVAAPAAAKPFPTPEGSELRMRGGDQSELSERLIGARLTGLEARLEDALVQQSRDVGLVAARAQREAERYRYAIMSVGLDPDRLDKVPAGIGGPFVPVGGDAFERALAEAQRSTAVADHVRRAVRALPFRRPLDESPVYSSSFGTRLDPFTRGLALHTGVDMRADYGAPARATAPGRVSVAEYSGGYGNMVEVDHGNGVATRYAHLAAFTVVPGQRVEAGSIVGRVGSTGRSTGNHLHYETRIDGEPVDPQSFLRVADALDAETLGAR